MYRSSSSKSLLKLDHYNYRAATTLSCSSMSTKQLSKTRTRILSEDDSDLREAMFSLVAGCMGTGCLSLPIILKYSGLIPGISLIILSAYLSYLSMNSVSLAADRKNLFDYSKLVKKLLGRVSPIQNTSLFLNIILVSYLFISVVGYQYVCIECILKSCNYFNLDYQNQKPWIMVFYSLTVVYPLSLLKKLVEHRYLCYFTMVSILYICITIVLDLPSYVKDHKMKDLRLFNLDLYIFTSFTFALFSYACQMSVTSVFAKMKNHSVSRMKMVNFRVCFYQMLFFIVLAVVGYLSLLDDTPLFIIRRSLPKGSTDSFNLFAARVLVAIIMLYTMPLFVMLCTESIQNLMIQHKRQTFSDFW